MITGQAAAVEIGGKRITCAGWTIEKERDHPEDEKMMCLPECTFELTGTFDVLDEGEWDDLFLALCAATPSTCEVCGEPATHVIRVVNGDDLVHSICQAHLDELVEVAYVRGVPVVDRRLTKS